MKPYYERNGIRIYHADCLEWLPTLEAGSVDAVVTSPPYNLGEHHRDRKKHWPYPDSLPEPEYQGIQEQVLLELHRIAECVFYNHKNRIRSGMEISPRQWIGRTPWIIRQECVWINGGPNHDPIRFFPKTERIYWLAKESSRWLDNHSQWDVFDDYPDHIDLEGSGHTRTFPISLVIRILDAGTFSTILDPFTGSGTTAIACIRTGRSFVGCEIEEAYCENMARRIDAELDQGRLFTPPTPSPVQRTLMG